MLSQYTFCNNGCFSFGKAKISAFVICGLLRSKRALYLVNTSEEIVFSFLC